MSFTSLNPLIMKSRGCQLTKWKLLKVHWKIPVVESSVNFTKLSGTSFPQSTSGHQLLTVLDIYSQQTNVVLAKKIHLTFLWILQFVIFKPLSYCFEERTGFDAKASLASRLESRLIRWYNEPGDITKEFW